MENDGSFFGGDSKNEYFNRTDFFEKVIQIIYLSINIFFW